MKIPMYELLGLVKDNKAPKKAIYDDELLFYDSDTNDYYNYEGNHSLFYGVNRRLDAEVEIIEAKVMFEKLGYSLRDKNEYVTNSEIIYDKKNSFSSIYFDLDKTIDVSGRIIDLNLLQAINRQVEELGWNK